MAALAAMGSELRTWYPVFDGGQQLAHREKGRRAKRPHAPARRSAFSVGAAFPHFLSPICPGVCTGRFEGENVVQMRQVFLRLRALQAKGRGPSAKGLIGATWTYSSPRPSALGPPGGKRRFSSRALVSRWPEASPLSPQCGIVPERSKGSGKRWAGMSAMRCQNYPQQRPGRR